MRNKSVCVLALLAFCAATANSEDFRALRLVQTIPLPGVRGRMDHMDVDVRGKRLFVAGLENNSLEVIDLAAGKWVASIPGFKKPQGVWYVDALNKLYVASGDDGMLRVLRGSSLAPLQSITLDMGANRIAYDPSKKYIYVGYGGKDAGKDYGDIAIIDAEQDKEIDDVTVAAHPAEVLLDKSGTTLFTCIPGTNQIQVIDTDARIVVSTWPTKSERPGDMALDSVRHRLFVGTHKPPELIVFDSQSGKTVDAIPTVEGLDGVYFDSIHNRVYVSGGRGESGGSVWVYEQRDADHYELISKVPTRPGAGTSEWVPELNRYYVAAPGNEHEAAAILVFDPANNEP
jgi:DNA-binding beta-propeller fold protein YncE